MHSRRDFAKTALALIALPAVAASKVFAIELTVRGVKLGITTASLNPLPQVPGKDPLEVEQRLLKFVPDEFKLHAHHWLILHGRYVCVARKPHCPACIIRDLCEYPQKTREEDV